MAEYLVELYVTRDDRRGAVEQQEHAQRAATELSAEGVPVRCVRSIFVPEDETCLLLLEAPSAQVAQEVLVRAGLRGEHLAATEPGTTSTTGTTGTTPSTSRRSTA